MLQSPIALGSARAHTLADGEGKTMELIPNLFYVQAGATNAAVHLGSARVQTRADTIGPRSELVPNLKYAQPGDE